MEEIKENEYIRLENGIILKYGEEQSVKIENNTYTDYSGEYEWSSIVVKHSSEIIDLIEVGDYVNRERILDITGDYIHTNETVHNKFYLAKHIKSIVTKELFEDISYKVEV